MNRSEKFIKLIEDEAESKYKLELKDVAKQVGLRITNFMYDAKDGMKASFVGKNRPGTIEYDPKSERFYIDLPYYWGKGWSHHAPDFETDGQPGGDKESAISFLRNIMHGGHDGHGRGGR